MARPSKRKLPPKKSAPAAKGLAAGAGGKLMSSAAQQPPYTGSLRKAIVSYRVTEDLRVEGLVFSVIPQRLLDETAHDLGAWIDAKISEWP
jgi:hypothetical protein